MSDPTRVTIAPDRLGTLERGGERWQLRFVRHFERAPADVWPALVDPELLSQWFPDVVVGAMVPGGELEFRHEGGLFEPFHGEVLELDEPRLLVLTWGTDRLRFELAAAEAGTELTFTVQFDEQGKAARDGAGWHECLDNLQRVLASDPDAFVGAKWAAAHGVYVERFGPEASTIGPPREFLDAEQD
jgi:uncharacterized protein YndB with AHSA1/START domain